METQSQKETILNKIYLAEMHLFYQKLEEKSAMSCICSLPSSLGNSHIPSCTLVKLRCSSSSKKSNHRKAERHLQGAAFPVAEIELASATLMGINTF